MELGIPGVVGAEEIGRGGFAVVYRAFQPAAARTVAIKVLTSEVDHDWQQRFWGPHYPKLAAVKRKYDPDGLFFVHHGVGSEAWSADGFTRLHGG